MANGLLAPIKVTIEHKKSVTEIIPEDVTRAKYSRWLDVISPVTEWCGLRGDELRHKRDLLRLEREAALYEVAVKLKPKLEGKTITAIPAKTLIPVLERASLEEPGSEFIEKWANLLASAAIEPGDDASTCGAILAELGHNEAALLDDMQERLIKTDIWPNKLDTRGSAAVSFLGQIYNDVRNLMVVLLDPNGSDQSEKNKQLAALVSESPALVYHINFALDQQKSHSVGLQFDENQRVAVDILEYRNLIKKDAYRNFAVGSLGLVSIHYFALTDLGIRFLQRVSGK
jgi:hypothetical protein